MTLLAAILTTILWWLTAAIGTVLLVLDRKEEKR